MANDCLPGATTFLSSHLWLGHSCPSIHTPSGLDSLVQAFTHGQECPCYKAA